MFREYDVVYPYGVGGNTLLDRIQVCLPSNCFLLKIGLFVQNYYDDALQIFWENYFS